MTEAESWLLEMRFFKVQPGTRAEFDRISREGTIPMMRRYGINVVDFGPMLNDEDGYYLLRAFRSEEDRVEKSQAIYATTEWEENYDAPVTSMISDYRTAVFPATHALAPALVPQSA